MLRTYATFTSTLPDDQQEKDGEIVAPGGRSIMGRLRDGLARRGFSVSEMEQHENYGWCFDVIAPACRIWCLIQFCEPWLLITDRRGGFLRRLFGPSVGARSEFCGLRAPPGNNFGSLIDRLPGGIPKGTRLGCRLT